MKNAAFLFLLSFLPGLIDGQTITSGRIEIIQIDSFSPQHDFKNPEKIAPEISDTIVVTQNGVLTVMVVNGQNLFQTFERRRDTTVCLFSDASVLSYSRNPEDIIVRYFDFSRMLSYNYRKGESGPEKHMTFRMFEDWHLPKETLTEYKEDRSRTMEMAGISGFYVQYRIQTKQGEKIVKGYISDKVTFPLALSSPKDQKVQFLPLYLEEYLIKKPENKKVVQLISMHKLERAQVEQQIKVYTGNQ